MTQACKIFWTWLGLVAVLIIWPVATSAQALPVAPTIKFDSFTGTYHLSRDAKGRSLLTTEEVILADFPSNGRFYGITRVVPKTYQGHGVEIKILSVTDAAGTVVPYKTASDKSGNLIITTGDPAITVYGLQTFRISYQTRGVINLDTPENEFLLNTNGRGWDQSINQVSAALHIPKIISSSLAPKASCYIGYLNMTTYNCDITSRKSLSETIISAKALGSLAAHHALVVKISFTKGTFTNKTDFWNNQRLALAGMAVVAVSLAGFWFAKRSSR